MILTPQFQALKLAQSVGLSFPLYIKREDLHPYHSHKGRSIPLMIDKYIAEGWRNFVISSSGNAALCALLYIKEHNLAHENQKINLHILVGKKIPLHKLKYLTDELNENITLKQTENPKQEAFQIDKDGTAKFLRQSTDDTALLGYTNLANELAEIKDLGAVFVPTSSGTCALGLHLGFKKIGINPQIHIVQTDACSPIAGAIYEKNIRHNQMPSLASAIVDNVALRKEAVLEALKESGGYGWVANNNEIRDAVRLIKQTTNLEISPNSALSLVGLIKALQVGYKIKGVTVLLFTGE